MCRKWPAELHMAALLRMETTQDRAARRKVSKILSPWSATPASLSPWIFTEEISTCLSRCYFHFCQSWCRRLICNILKVLDFVLGYFDSYFLFPHYITLLLFGSAFINGLKWMLPITLCYTFSDFFFSSFQYWDQSFHQDWFHYSRG